MRREPRNLIDNARLAYLYGAHMYQDFNRARDDLPSELALLLSVTLSTFSFAAAYKLPESHRKVIPVEGSFFVG